jgi:3-phenylpropionate/trans-cinnamate dioxygenase ferredoxin reductase subunit
VTNVVIIGAGHAGAQLAIALRQKGFGGGIELLSSEPELPYQRPPLSKEYLRAADRTAIRFRTAEFFDKQRINFVPDAHAVDIDRAGKQVLLADGRRCAYDVLALATGTRARNVSVDGADLDDVLVLNSLAWADALRKRLRSADRLAIIGGGFIGLEVASTAQGYFNVRTTVVEMQERLMARAVTPPVSSYFQDRHQSQGTDIRLGVGVTAIRSKRRHVTGVELTDGSIVDADVVLLGLGVAPEVSLAERCGLAVDNGVTVDKHFQTSDEHIFAIGDCAARHDGSGGVVRVKSVQNAAAQARALAVRLTTGSVDPYDDVPWFWSEQAGTKIQMAGLSMPHDEVVLRSSETPDRFSVYAFTQGKLVGVESISDPGTHMAARKVLAAAVPLSPVDVRQIDFNLKDLARTTKPTGAAARNVVIASRARPASSSS